MKRAIKLYLIFMTTQVFGNAPLEDAYKDGLSNAQSNMQESVNSIKNLNPTDVFKDQGGKSYYTENPPQISHYQGITQGNKDVLEEAGRTGIDKNEATKEVWKNFGNPKIKIDPNELWLSKSNNIIKNAADITTNTSTGLDCKESEICRVEFTKKTCNEETRPLKKICEKVPKITTSIETIAYPNCRSLVLVEGTLENNGLCPYGYGTSDYMYMIRFSGPNVRFCTKAITIAEGTECFGGFFGAGIMHQNYRVSGAGTGIVPKKMKSRIRISHAYRGFIAGTIVNNTTGVVLYNKARFNNGQTIELPFSETQDQIFRFYAEAQGWSCPLGIMTLYVDHYYKEKVAKLESWEEKNCNES